MRRPATIACLDLDTFFVSVERLLDPRLVGLPVVVGATADSRGVVTSASYEVRKLGVRSGMPAAEARRLAPDAVFLPGQHGVYSRYTAAVREVVERHCPEVRTASIDEFFLDFAGCERMLRRRQDPDDETALRRHVWVLRDRIQAEVGLPASVGVGTSRPIAKMASGLAKPAGVHFVGAGREADFIEDLPVRKLPGIGPVMEQKLLTAGFPTLGSLYRAADVPAHLLGVAAGLRLAVEGGALGVPERDRPAFREHDPYGELDGGLSNERTFSRDLRDPLRVDAELVALVERVTWRLRQRGGAARTVSVKLRYSNFDTYMRSRTLPTTDTEAAVLAAARALLAGAWERRRGLRLLGVGLSQLREPDRQLHLPFTAAYTPQRAAVALDAVRARFGFDAIRLGPAARGQRSAGGA